MVMRASVSSLSVGLFPDCWEVVGVRRLYQQDQQIFGEGEASEHVYKVLRGVVRIYKLLEDGRRQISAFFFPGDIFGLELVESYGSTAEAVVTAHVAVFQRRLILAAASRSIEVARELWTRTALNLHHAEQHMLLLGRKTALERIEAFLAEMEQRSHRAGHVNLPMPRRDIADYLGLTIETVSRSISQLKSEGDLQLSGARRIALRSAALLSTEPARYAVS